MKETLLYISITILWLLIMYLYFYWKSLKYFAKTMLSEPNPNNIICLVIKKTED